MNTTTYNDFTPNTMLLLMDQLNLQLAEVKRLDIAIVELASYSATHSLRLVSNKMRIALCAVIYEAEDSIANILEVSKEGELRDVLDISVYESLLLIRSSLGDMLASDTCKVIR